MSTEVPDIRAVIAQLREDPRMKDAIGVCEGREPADEIVHFYICKACGQPVDKRDLGQVFHHEDEGHAPLPVEDETRLLRISDELRAVLAAKEREGGSGIRKSAAHGG